MTSLIGIPVDRVVNVWPRVEEMIEDAVDRTEFCSYTLAEIYQELREGKMQMWTVPEIVGDVVVSITSVGLTKVYDTAQFRSVSIFLVAGKIDEVLEAQDEIIDWARRIDAKLLEAYGRPGWDRVLKSAGWKSQPRWIKRLEH